jgi:hypothetical protein
LRHRVHRPWVRGRLIVEHLRRWIGRMRHSLVARRRQSTGVVLLTIVALQRIAVRKMRVLAVRRIP